MCAERLWRLVSWATVCFVGVTCVARWHNSVSELHHWLSWGGGGTMGGGGVMQQFGMNETHEEAAH